MNNEFLKKIIQEELKKILQEANLNLNSIRLDKYVWTIENNAPIFKNKNDMPDKANINFMSIIPKTGLTMVSFWSWYCKPCLHELPFFYSILPPKNISFIPIITQKSEELGYQDFIEYSINHNYIKLNSRVSYYTTEKTSVGSVPLNILFKDGREIARTNSFDSSQDLEIWLNQHLQNVQSTTTQQFKNGVAVRYIPHNRWFIVSGTNKNGTINIKDQITNIIYTVEAKDLSTT